MKKRGVEEEEGVTRRTFLKGAVAAGTAAFLGGATYGTLRSLQAPPTLCRGEIHDDFTYVRPVGAPTDPWFVQAGLEGEVARMSHFEPGRAANVIWKRVLDEQGNITCRFPGLLIQLEEDAIEAPDPFPRETFVVEGLYAIFNCCTHACCRPGWELIGRTGYKVDLGYTNIYCPCHDSQYNPRSIAQYTHDRPPAASGATYWGVFKEPGVGPAPRGMPLIPVDVAGDRIVGRLEDPATPEWYQYLDFKNQIVPTGEEEGG